MLLFELLYIGNDKPLVHQLIFCKAEEEISLLNKKDSTIPICEIDR